MKKINLGIINYNKQYKNFLNFISQKNSRYHVVFNKKLNFNKDIKSLKEDIVKNQIKILVICDHFALYNLNKDINFFIKKKIKIVRASTNKDVKDHGFIIEKPFRDFSFEEIFFRDTLKVDTKSINKIFNNKKILVTGGAGSIGGALVKKILKFNIKKIYVLDNSEYNVFRFKIHNENKKNFNKVKFIVSNIENSTSLSNDISKLKPDIIFHAAALKHVGFLEDNIKQGIYTNIIGTRNILKASVENKVKYFIHVSTDKAASPKNILGMTKLISEYLCHNFSNKNTQIGIVRFGNVFNSNGSVAEIFKMKMLNAQKIEISHPKVERYFMSDLEASNLIISAFKILNTSKNLNNCRLFICDMGKPINILDLAKKMIFLSGRSPAKFLSTKFYGLGQIEKMTEKLVSLNERIINKIENDHILELDRKKNKINLKEIEKILKYNSSNKILKKKLVKISKSLINK
jgi:FlaA1/EpsC-like NDP-sugar epimerase